MRERSRRMKYIYCPVCGFEGEYDEMVYSGSEVVGCMMCEGEEE